MYFAINIDPSLREKLEQKYQFKFSDLKLLQFADGEYLAQPQLSVRGKKVYVFHSLSDPVNENLMKLLITIDALKRSSAREINLIITYLAYTRQDRRTAERTAITSKLVANLISVAGADKVTTIDLHSEQIEGFFDIPVDHLHSAPVFAEHLIKTYGKQLQDFVIVSPDFGASKRARMLSDLLSIPIVIMEKIRDQIGGISRQYVYGEVNFMNCLIFDDMIGTGGTVISAAKTLRDLGAKSVIVCATHGLFSGQALEKFEEAFKEGIISKIMVSDSIPARKKYEFIDVVNTDGLIAQVIKIYVQEQGSIAQVYEQWKSEILALKDQL
nr:ribose-phosphate diphosphokinase [Candidatus Mycoplasma haematolamae]